MFSVSINSFLPDNIYIYIFHFQNPNGSFNPRCNMYIYIYIYVCVCVCVLVGLRILHSYLIESSCTQYEKIDKLKCKLQAQKDYY